MTELAPNGINGATGSYLLPGITAEDLARVARGEKLDPDHLRELQHRRRASDNRHLGVIEGVDAKRLDQSGWGVVFAHSDAKTVDAWREALAPLLQRRRDQAGDRYREFTGPDAYRPDESKSDFLRRHGAGPGPVDPNRVPYYLLVVGGPEAIPYTVQYQLDVQYAVGRLDLDSAEELASYARTVVAAETGEIGRPRRATLLGVRNRGDRATELSATELVRPLAKSLRDDLPDWQIDRLLADEASKAALLELLEDPSGPALVFTASHGMAFPLDDSRQLPHQGALLCQDWPGPLDWGEKPIPQDHYLAADDVGGDAALGGLISFHFACYGAGTPHLDDFAHRASGQPTPIAPRPFVARLPQRLLGHPRGTALAAIGHVDRTWGCSYHWSGAGRQLAVFQSALERLLAGYPVGSAMEYFDERYAELASDLTATLNDAKYGKQIDPLELAEMWTANNDARSYVVLGDPAVRLPLRRDGDSASANGAAPATTVGARAPRRSQPGASTRTSDMSRRTPHGKKPVEPTATAPPEAAPRERSASVSYRASGGRRPPDQAAAPGPSQPAPPAETAASRPPGSPTAPLRYVGAQSHLMGDSPGGELEFESVVMRIFPLRANLNRLETLCDRYLNQDIPDHIARFRPASPWVLMMVINYGRMAPRGSNIGWVAQNEILFNVPLVGHWNDDGEMLTEPATVSPFIFVDNDFSVTTGREVYGWPKIPVWLEPGLSPWLRDPRQRQRLLDLKIQSFAELYAGERAAPKTLLEIEQESPQLLSQPPALDYALGPWSHLPKAIYHSWASLPEMVQAWTHLGEDGRRLAETLPRMFQMAARGGDLYGNTINPKQFRGSVPDQACYQSLVNARMLIKRFNGGGMLGDLELLRGDPSGGFRIFLHRLGAYPILESLGLEADEMLERDGRQVASIRPLLPFWVSVDMSYEAGRRICWRSSASGADSGWKAWRRSNCSQDPVEKSAAEEPTPAEHEAPRLPAFNTTLGPVVEAVKGPFDFYGATIRVLPLPAHSAQLRKILPDLRPLELSARLEFSSNLFFDPVPQDDAAGGAPDSLVLLIATSYGRMAAAENDIGWWASQDLALAVVVKTDRVVVGPSGPERKTPHFLYWAYQFSDSPVAVTEGREVLGLPTTYGRIRSGADPWMDQLGPDQPRRLLSLSTLDLPAIGLGQEARERVLVDVERPAGASEDPSGSLLYEFLEDGLDAFAGGLRIPGISLKELRDEEHPDRPCYQAVVAFERTLRRCQIAGTAERVEKPEIQPLPGPIEVRIHRSESYPLVQALGLAVDRWEVDERGAETAVCTAIAPFWMQADLRAELPMELSYRTLDSSWSLPPGDLWRRRFTSLTGASHEAGATPPWVAEPQEGSAELAPVSVFSREELRKRADEPTRSLEDLVCSVQDLVPRTMEEAVAYDKLTHPGAGPGDAEDASTSLPLGAFVGHYDLEHGDSLEIALDRDRLTAAVPGQPAVELYRVAESESEMLTEHGAQVKFDVDPSTGAVRGVLVRQGAAVWTGSRAVAG